MPVNGQRHPSRPVREEPRAGHGAGGEQAEDGRARAVSRVVGEVPQRAGLGLWQLLEQQRERRVLDHPEPGAEQHHAGENQHRRRQPDHRGHAERRYGQRRDDEQPKLHPVADIYAGVFFYELESARDLLRFFADFISDAPEAYGAFPAFQIAPPLEFIPAPRVGDTFCAAIVHFAGPLDAGDKAMEPFRAVAPVVAEMAGPMPYPALNTAFDALFPKGIRSYWKGSFVTELTDAAIDQHLIHGPQVPDVTATMHLYPINGACHRVGAHETAFAYRDATFAQVILAAWPDPAHDEQRIRWVRDYYQATAPYSEPGGYINFMADDDSARVEDNYRGHYKRLAQIKRAYDPGNLFHLNQNIPPAS
jgi:hypothetical protein